MEEITLFCLPFAGGSATYFSRWSKYFNSKIRIQPVELAGRGSRLSEPHYSSIDEATEDVFRRINSMGENRKMAIFGHSMGGLIAYKVAEKFCSINGSILSHLFISGRPAPSVISNRRKLSSLPEDAFREEIRNMGGAPAELFEHPELWEIFLPILKNDFYISETSSWSVSDSVNVDITVFLGKGEGLSSEECDSWKNSTRGNCIVQYFDGGHFFVNSALPEIARTISWRLLS